MEKAEKRTEIVLNEIRIATYMCPTHPVGLYEVIMELLEEALDCFTSLEYESRFPGPPVPASGRPDPFVIDKIDLAFMTAAAYLRLRETGNKCMELLPVTPVFSHRMNTNSLPGYFSDVIVHSDKVAHNVSTLLDLRGCTFAYSDEESFSSSKIVLSTLNRKGENASFFGSTLRSGSHLASAQMVLSKQADWAAVDSTTLLYSKKYMQDGGKEIVTLETLGRLPPYPVVVNTRLAETVKKNITNALLTLPSQGIWKKKFEKFGVIKFASNNDTVYEGTAAQMRATAAQEFSVRFY